MRPMPTTLTVEQTAAVLAIARGSAYRGVKRGEIPSVRIGRRILVPAGALAEQFSIPLPVLAARLDTLTP